MIITEKFKLESFISTIDEFNRFRKDSAGETFTYNLSIFYDFKRTWLNRNEWLLYHNAKSMVFRWSVLDQLSRRLQTAWHSFADTPIDCRRADKSDLVEKGAVAGQRRQVPAPQGEPHRTTFTSPEPTQHSLRYCNPAWKLTVRRGVFINQQKRETLLFS